MCIFLKQTLPKNVFLKDTYFLRSLDIKNQDAFYGEHVNQRDIMRGMLVYSTKEAQIFH